MPGLVAFENPAVRRAPWATPPDREPLRFHGSLPGYAPTPLRDAPELAGRLGVGGLWLKDETRRLGLPAFKIVGASWAVARVLGERLGLAPDAGLEPLRAALTAAGPVTLVTATDGNHGRAVARMARLLGLPARIYVPDDMVAARHAAIADEGARVVVVDGGYDEAVRASADSAGEDELVISDTSWPGYEAVPAAIADGYSTILWEIDDELRRRGEPDPDTVLVPVGVGALAAAVVRHYRRPGLDRPPAIVSVEPASAACALASARAGAPVTVGGPHTSIMAGLNCPTPSPIAWPLLAAGVDLFVAIDDDDARAAMRDLADAGIAGGECAGAGLGTLRAWERAGSPALPGLDPAARVLAFLTEGPTDPAGYAAAVGRAPDEVAPVGGRPAA